MKTLKSQIGYAHGNILSPKSAYAFGPPILLVGKARKPNFNNSTLVVMYHNILMHVNVGIYYRIMSVPQNNVTHLDNVMMVSYASIKVG